MIVEAVDTAVLLLAVAVAWAGAIGGAVGFVVCVVAYCAAMLIAPGARASRNRPSARQTAEAPESAPRLPRPSDRRPAPRWARPVDDTPDTRNCSEAA